MRNVATKTLRDYNRAILFWSAGLVLSALMMMSVYPSVKKSAPQLADYVANMPDAFKAMFGLERMDYSSPAGYLNTELFSLLLPISFAVFAMGAGSRAIAGERDRGTLDLLLSTPISRGSVVLQKFIAMAADIAVLVVVLWLSLWLSGIAFSFDMGADRLLAGSINCGLLALFIGSVALAVGSWRGGRGLAIGVTSTVLVAGFLLRSLSEIVHALEPWRLISPFYWYGRSDVLRNGLNLGDAAVLLGASLVLLGVSVVAFDRRDLHA